MNTGKRVNVPNVKKMAKLPIKIWRLLPCLVDDIQPTLTSPYFFRPINIRPVSFTSNTGRFVVPILEGIRPESHVTEKLKYPPLRWFKYMITRAAEGVSSAIVFPALGTSQQALSHLQQMPKGMDAACYSCI